MKKLVTCAALALALVGSAYAQDRTIQHRREYTIKRDQVANFVATVKDLNALYKKANIDAPTLVFQGITGPEKFTIIRYYAKVSDALANRTDLFKDYATEYQSLNTRLMACVQDRQTRISIHDTELSLPRPDSIPPFLRTVRTEVKPGKVDEYRALIKEWVAKGIKPSGAPSYNVSRTSLGGSSMEFHSSTGLKSLADLDEQKVVKAMGEANARAWADKRNAIINSSEANVVRYRADMSTWK